jgi:ComF family protein
MKREITTNSGYLCIQCISEVPFTDHFELKYENALVQHFYGRFSVTFGVAMLYFTSGGMVQEIMHTFKYKGELYVGRSLGKMLAQRLKECTFRPEFDMIISVPIHFKRQFKRGFNQSDILAQEIASVLHLPFERDLLIKILETESQTTKTRKERLENIANAIAIEKNKINEIKGKRILIVDDTITTGSTLEACGVILLKNGAASISIACVAIAK